jgi:hypothetical protein
MLLCQFLTVIYLITCIKKTMCKKHHFLAFALILIAISAIANLTFAFMSVLIVVWFSIAAITKVLHFDKKLSDRERKLYKITIILYPLFETIIKYFLLHDIIAQSWFWINRFEHFLSAIAIEILLYPLLKPTLKKLSLIESLIFSICTITFVGNLNEFLEYFIRHILGTYRLNFFYWDTIYDMAMNILGATCGFLILPGWKNKRKLNTKLFLV